MTFAFNLLPYRPVPTGLSIYVQRLLGSWHGRLPSQLKLSSDGSLLFSRDSFLAPNQNSYLMRLALSFAAVQYFVPVAQTLRFHGVTQIYSPYPDYLWSLSHLPQTITCHDLSPLFIPNSRRASFYARYVLPRHFHAATRIVAISRTVANQLTDIGISASKVEVIYNGVSGLSFPPNRNQGFDSLCIARHARNKNLGLLLRGFAKFLRQSPDWPGRLIIVGSFGRATHNLRQLERELVLTDRVCWLPYLPTDELRSLLLRSFCLISSSLMEGFDYPLLEAQSFGLPTLASSIPVHEELHHGTSLFFALDDHGDTMAQQLLRLSREPALWRQLSQAGLRNAAAHTSQRQTRELQHLLYGTLP